MISDKNHTHAFVWIWLPGETEPVVAGKLEKDNGNLLFNYGKSYLERINDVKFCISIYEPELPLKKGFLPLPNGLSMPSSIRDAAPDTWGRRVIINKKLGFRHLNDDTSELDELTYLLESGSDRIGALDFQQSPTIYEARLATNVSLDELIHSADRVERGVPLTHELDLALYHGTAIGGARPKALVESDNKKYVAKFSSNTDLFSVVKAEFIAMRLADCVGLDVAKVRLENAAKRDVLLIERFDREHISSGWSRKSMVSALTLFGLDEMMAGYASYENFAEIIRHRFVNPKNTLKELFSRIVFNILCGNTDDHARNHAAFWDGESLSLTPAYDICPQGRTSYEASQAMFIHGDNNLSQLRNCIATAHNFFLSEADARVIIERQITIIEEQWNSICQEANLNEIDKALLWKRQFLNAYSIQGFNKQLS